MTKEWRESAVIGRFSIPFDRPTYQPVLYVGEDVYDCLGFATPLRRAPSGKFMICYKRRVDGTVKAPYK